jgi:hypothetical protein
MFVDRKEAFAPARVQRGLKESASPDRHGFHVMIFVTDVEIVHTRWYFGVNNVARWVFVT